MTSKTNKQRLLFLHKDYSYFKRLRLFSFVFTGLFFIFVVIALTFVYQSITLTMNNAQDLLHINTPPNAEPVAFPVLERVRNSWQQKESLPEISPAVTDPFTYREQTTPLPTPSPSTTIAVPTTTEQIETTSPATSTPSLDAPTPSTTPSSLQTEPTPVTSTISITPQSPPASLQDAVPSI